jgi:hypothetical protein
VAIADFWKRVSKLISNVTQNSEQVDKAVEILRRFCLQTNRNSCMPTRKRWNNIRGFLKMRGIGQFYSPSMTSQIVKFARKIKIDAGSDPRDDVHDFISFLKEVDKIFFSSLASLWHISKFDTLTVETNSDRPGTYIDAPADVSYLIVYGENKKLPLFIDSRQKYYKLQSVCIQIMSMWDQTFHIVALARCEEYSGDWFLYNDAIASSAPPDYFDVSKSDVFGIKKDTPFSTSSTPWVKFISTLRSRFVAVYAEEKIYDFNKCKI